MRLRSVFSALLVLSLALFGGCSAPAPAASSAGARTIQIVLRDGKASPNAEQLQVARGTQLTLEITSDRADEVHVHGYDLQVPVVAGTPVSKTFTADQTGRFEIETHKPATTLVILDVR